MPSWTKEQELAITSEGKNIIVSAGAGSGKTAVLTARVIRKLKDGIDINKLLVLTFTNEAAGEMKTRIRDEIRKISSLKEQLNYIDNSYITTFDSFALSIVSKYHYLLNLSKKIDIIDSSIMNIKREEFLDKIFNALYDEKREDFLRLIGDFCVKDDKDIKKQILKINSALDLKYDKKEYMDSYISNYYSNSYIDNIIEEYKKLILDKKSEITDIYNYILEYEDSKICEKYIEALSNFVNSNNYDDIKNNLNIVLPRIVKNSKEEKMRISELLEELRELTIYEDLEEIRTIYLSTKDYAIVIIDIIKELDSMLEKYKKYNNSYEFVDIAKMAIKIVSDNEEIRNEIKYFYNEIMIDEYQDTNDLQESFINLIENNNVYMVGDIKQSIYRFRNANPFIFKSKYDLYSDNLSGIKIDLLKNFRSRKEVLNDINKIFTKIMDDFLGGADYYKSHQMVFGNRLYDENVMENNNNFMEIYNYNYKDFKEFSNAEKEAFIIANDIQNKIDNNYMILDKHTGIFRKSKYSDFCIIMDRGSDFELYKKIFEYKNIPLSVYQDEKLTTEYDMYIIKNLVKLVIKVKENKFDQEFRYYYTSIARSYLFEMSDEDILKVFKNNSFIDSNIYKISSDIARFLDNMSCHSFLNEVLDKFNFYEKCISYRNIEGSMIRVLYLQKIASNLENLGYTPYSFADYLSKMIDSDQDIKYKINTSDNDAVKIMNIHKSKGLEFPVCYYSGLYKKFNIRDVSERFMFDSKYGIVTPYYKEGIGALFTKFLIKENYIKEEISEKIRLLYVAMTRAREKMILVAPLDDNIYNNEKIVSNSLRLKYRSFLDIINTIKDNFDSSIFNINFEDIKLNKDYKLYKTRDLSFLNSDNRKIIKKNIHVDDSLITEEKFSKINYDLKTLEELNNMKLGTYIHYLFEVTDFYNPGDNVYVNKLLKHDLFKNIKDANIYKEYEFIYEEDDSIYHGVIDLMIVYNDYIDIVDYKLSNIADDSYKMQLEGYRKYISNKFNKNVNIYLYSISKDTIQVV